MPGWAAVAFCTLARRRTAAIEQREQMRLVPSSADDRLEPGKRAGLANWSVKLCLNQNLGQPFHFAVGDGKLGLVVADDPNFK